VDSRTKKLRIGQSPANGLNSFGWRMYQEKGKCGRDIAPEHFAQREFHAL